MNREQRRLSARLARQHKAKKARATKLGGLAAIGNSLPYATAVLAPPRSLA